jgi:drug/metabolite transporter (DMT)-like permease
MAVFFITAGFKVMWIFWALLSRFISAGSNVVESHYYHKIFKNGYTQCFISSLYWFLILPVLFLFRHPEFPPLDLWPWIILAGVAYAISLVSFYECYGQADTSSVVVISTLGRIFVPIMAFLFYGETLSFYGYIGFGIVLLGSLILSYKQSSKKIEWRPVMLMMISGFGFSIYTTASKHVMASMPSWFDGWFYVVLVGYLTAFCQIFVPRLRPMLLSALRHWPRYGLKYSSYAFLCLASMSTYSFALSQTKASHVIMAAQFQPFFTLALSYFFSRFGWFYGKESFTFSAVQQKAFAFVIMSLGLMLTLLG